MANFWRSSALVSTTRSLGLGESAVCELGKTQPGKINHHDGGRGFYFEDPNGHFLEIITRPYGSGGYTPSASAY